MDGLIGIGVALLLAAIAARSIIREAAPGGAHRPQRAGSRRETQEAPPVEQRAPAAPITGSVTEATRSLQPTPTPHQAPAAQPAPARPAPVAQSAPSVEQHFTPVLPTPPRATTPAAPTPREAPTGSGHSDNGLVITPFRPPARPSQPRRVKASVTVDLLPGARIEVVDLDDVPAIRHPALRPDPDRLIQHEIAEPVGLGARIFALTRLVLGVTACGVIFGVGIVISFRAVVALFRALF